MARGSASQVPSAEDCAAVVQFDTAPNLQVSHLVVGPSPKRRRITFVGPNTGRVTLSNNTPVTIDQGLTLTGTAGIVELCLYVYGDVVNKPWYAIYPAGATPCAFIEVMDP